MYAFKQKNYVIKSIAVSFGLYPPLTQSVCTLWMVTSYQNNQYH